MRIPISAFIGVIFISSQAFPQSEPTKFQTSQDQNVTNAQERPSLSPSTAPKPSLSTPAQKAFSNDFKNRGNQATKEWQITDWIQAISAALVALFTACLVCLNRSLLNATKKAADAAADSARAAKVAAEIDRQQQRAYIFGGPGCRLPVDGAEEEDIVITLENYGRTPGILKKISWGICPEADFYEGLEFQGVLVREDAIQPDMDNPKPVRAAKCRIKKGGPNQVFYGRIDYLDIFKDKHYSTWKHRVLPNGKDEPLEGAYSDWD